MLTQSYISFSEEETAAGDSTPFPSSPFAAVLSLVAPFCFQLWPTRRACWNRSERRGSPRRLPKTWLETWKTKARWVATHTPSSRSCLVCSLLFCLCVTLIGSVPGPDAHTLCCHGTTWLAAGPAPISLCFPLVFSTTWLLTTTTPATSCSSRSSCPWTTTGTCSASRCSWQSSTESERSVVASRVQPPARASDCVCVCCCAECGPQHDGVHVHQAAALGHTRSVSAGFQAAQ